MKRSLICALAFGAALSTPAAADWFGKTEDKGFGQSMAVAASIGDELIIYAVCDKNTLELRLATNEAWNETLEAMPGVAIAVSVDGGPKRLVDATLSSNQNNRIMAVSEALAAEETVKAMALAKRRIDVGLQAGEKMIYSASMSASGSTRYIGRVLTACADAGEQ